MPAPTASLWASDHVLYEYLYKPIASQICFINPNIITLICFALVLPIIHGIRAGWPLWVLLLIAFIRQSMDCLDGAVARSCGTSSRLGAILDVLEDTLTVGLLSAFIVWVMYGKAPRIPMWVTAIVAVGMLWTFVRFVGYTRDAMAGRPFTQSSHEKFVHDNSVLSAMMTVGLFWWIQRY